MATVAFVGLGRMGLPMARRIVEAGHDVLGYEQDERRHDECRTLGIQVARDVGPEIAEATAIITMLPNGDIVKGVLENSVFPSVRGGHAVVIDCSTSDIEVSRELHVTAEQLDVRYLDAPVSGGVGGAEAGSLTVMVGGDKGILAEAKWLLQIIGKYVVHVGPGGAGQAAKVVNNMVFGICMAATCEALAMADRLELDLTQMYEVLTRSSADNWALRNWYPVPNVVQTSPSSNGYEPGFTSTLLIKDMGLAIAAAESTHSSLSVARATRDLLASQAGEGQLDCTSLFPALRNVRVTNP